MARYKADQPLPPNTISRFIVRHNEQIKKEETGYLVWRSGVVLDDDNGNIALVREDDRTISVSVKGSSKTIYISVLRETLNEIFSSYKSKKPELQYRIEPVGEMTEVVETQNPLWLPDRKILTHVLDNIPYYDENSRRQINLNYTVNNYNITAPTLNGEQGIQIIDQSTHNTFNFHNCNISLQENLNDLARRLTKAGSIEEAEEIKEAVELLEEAENCKTQEEVKKKGISRSLKRLVENLGDDESRLHKTVEGIKEGIGIAQDIAKGYNEVAQWLGLPQVPKPFLKKDNN
jgi:polyhydroxyalkanoate synthesis regulator phasin